MKVFKYALLFLLIALLALLSFEAYRVSVASNKTESIRAKFLGANELKLPQIPQKKVDALLKVEDPNFYNHHGIDLTTPGAGVTTISQSLAKFMYFEKFKPGFAKLEQALIAKFVVDTAFSKGEQLEVLFNHAYLGRYKGNSVFGFVQASKVYFGKEFSELTEKEYLSLVAMLVSPNGMHVLKYPKKNQLRVKRIMKLLDGSYIPSSVMDVYYSGASA